MPRPGSKYDDNYWPNHILRKQIMFDCARALHEVLAPSSVIDIGCGPGWTMEYWIREKPEVRIIGYDLRAWWLRKIASAEVMYSIFPTDVSKWRVEAPTGRFDLAICTGSVHADLEDRDHEILARGLMALAPTIFFARSSKWWEETFERTEGYTAAPKLLRKWREAMKSKAFADKLMTQEPMFFVRPNA